MKPDPLVDPRALRDARVKAGLTQHELARLIGVAGGERVSRWERGASAPRPEVLSRIAVVVNVTSNELLTAASGEADLRRMRVVAGLSARAVARGAHMSLPTYARWEAGRIDRMPPTAALAAVAMVLNVSVEEVKTAVAVSRRGSA